MQFDADALRQIFSLETAAAITSATILLLVIRIWSGIPALLDRWLSYRTAKAAEKAADWSRLREENKRLDERCIRLEKAEEECQAELADMKHRLASLEGYMAGAGKASQEAAAVVAIERLGERKRTGKPEGQ